MFWLFLILACVCFALAVAQLEGILKPVVHHWPDDQLVKVRIIKGVLAVAVGVLLFLAALHFV